MRGTRSLARALSFAAIAGSLALLLAAVAPGPAFAAGAAPVGVPDAVTPPLRLTSPNPTASGRFGSDVALSGDTIVVGAPQEDGGGGENSGRAYVYVRDHGAWQLQQTLTAADSASGDVFGCSVAIEGDKIAVGAPGKDVTALDRGQVYVYTRSAGVWTARASLTTTDTNMNGIGIDLDISGDTILAGEGYTWVGGVMYAGAATVFRGSGASWTAEGRLLPPDPGANMLFGHTVALDGDTAVIGANQGVPGAPMSGGAYVFTRSGSTWTLQQALHDPSYPSYARFGWDVDVRGDVIAVGSPGSYTYGRGHATTFTRTGGVWSVDAIHTVPSALTYDPYEQSYSFGKAVALGGSLLMVGDDYNSHPTGSGDYHGAIYTFSGAPGSWSYRGKSMPAVPQAGESLGASIDTDGRFVVSGAQAYDGGASQAGAVYVWDSLPKLQTAEETALTIPAPGVLRNDYDPEGDALAAGLTSHPAHGAVSMNADGSFVYVPEHDFFGEDTFTYRAFDGAAYSDPTSVTITVVNTPDPPVASPDATSCAQDSTLTVPAPGVLANDSDPDGDSLSAAVSSAPAHGTLTLGPDGGYRYRPANGFRGTDTFTYQVWDGTAASEPATVTIRVFGSVSLEGTDRYLTNIETARAGFADGSCDTLIVATGLKFPDALGAAALAGARGCPIILVRGDTVRSDIKAEMLRLTRGKTKKTVYILGSIDAVTAKMEASIKTALGAPSVNRVYKRLQGVDRYGTAREIAKEVRTLAGPRKRVFVVTGKDFPDALIVSPVAYDQRTPILLVKDTVDKALSDTIRSIGTSEAVIVASVTTVTPAIQGSLGSLLGSGNVTRPASSSSRYQQALDFAAWAQGAYPAFGWDECGIAKGEDFPDALGASVRQGQVRGFVLLTPKLTAYPGLLAALATHKDAISTVHFFGSVDAVSQPVRNAVMGAIR